MVSPSCDSSGTGKSNPPTIAYTSRMIALIFNQLNCISLVSVFKIRCFGQSFHKNGYKITAMNIIKMSSAKSKRTNWAGTPWLKISEKADFDSLTSSKS